MYQTLTYRCSTLRLASVKSSGKMINAKPTNMKIAICQGISRYSMPAVQPVDVAPMPPAMPMLSSEPPSMTQIAPSSRVRSKRGSSHTITPSAALVIQPYSTADR